MKNEDIDDLFRKAAENYEVDTSKASGWDAVNKALRNADDFNMEEADKEKKKRRIFFWWFLLLPALLVGYYSWKKTGLTGKKDTTAKAVFTETTKATNEKAESLSPGNTIINQSSRTAEHSLNKPFSNNNTLINKNESDNNKSKKDVISNKNSRAQNNPASNFIEHKESKPDRRPSDNTALNGGAGGITEKSSAIKNKVPAASINTHNKQLEKNKKTSGKNNQRNLIVVDNDTNNVIVQHLNSKRNNNTGIKNTDNIVITKPDKDVQKTIAGSFQYVFTAYDGRMLPVISFERNIGGMAPGIENLNADRGDSSLKKNKDKVDQKGMHYFYAAAVIGPDVSSVKFQRLAGTGSSTGLLLGYRINKYWHIETGALWEKKIYYTEGKYFDKSKLSPYLRDVEIMNADGNCYMITIPLNIRYNISAGEKNNWFIATGMSSYLMNKEYYDFTYRHPGGQPMTKGYNYKTAETNWITVINLNMGYERTFLKTFNFRIEPYFRLPVSGVGTGNLSLSSGGIYIGIGKKF